MLSEIALIDREEWDKGPEHVNPLIDRIVERHRNKPSQVQNQGLAKKEISGQARIARVRRAMVQNRKELPPTLNAIQGFILLEMERLEARNFRSDEDRAATLRQIGNYLMLHESVGQMMALVSDPGEASEADAEKMDGLLKFYWRKLSALPREKVDEVVDGVWNAAKGGVQIGLIGSSAFLGSMFGLPPLPSAVFGSMVFAPDKAGMILKAAKDLVQKN